MQPSEIVQRCGVVPQNWAARPAKPLLARFLGKFVLDIMPAALASVIGGFLFTQYQFGHTAAPRPAAEEATPASAEMMALVRDEHAMIIDYLKTQMAAEKNRLVADDAVAHDAAEAQTADIEAADATVAPETSVRRIAAVQVAARSAAARSKAVSVPVAAAPHAPLLIAQAQQNPGPDNGVVPADRIARDPNSLLAKTLELKDHMVAATRHVVFMIGDAFASVGERIGGAVAGGRQFSSDS